MGMVICFPQTHTRASLISAGHKSGRSSDRDTPVSRSIGKTNSAGTPRLERSSQYQTCDCVVPMRSAKGFCPPAKSQARLSASVDMGISDYPFLGELQPKNLCKTANLDFGTLEPMKEADPIAFGNRVKERREALGISQARLGDLCGYSQTNIGWVEQGKGKRPHIQAEALGQALRTPTEYLLWGTGPKEIGPPIMTDEEIRDGYNRLSPEDRAVITAAISERLAAHKKKRKTG